MKIKKLVAVLSAAALTVTSLSVAAFASGDPTPTPTAVGDSGTVSYTFDSNGKISTTTADNSKAIPIKDSDSAAVTSFTQDQVVLVTFAAADGETPTISVNDVDGKQAADGTTDLTTSDTSAKVVLTAATATEITLKGTNCTVTKVEVKDTDGSTAIGDSGTIEVVFDENGKIVTTATEQDVAIKDVESNAVTEFKKDDVVKVTFDAASASATVKVNNVAATLADDKTYATATLTANTAAKITLSGSNYTAKKVEVTRTVAGGDDPEDPEVTFGTKFEGSKDVGFTNETTLTIPSAEIPTLQTNNAIVITFEKKTDDCELKVVSNGNWETPLYYEAVTKSPVVITLTVEQAASLADQDLKIQGKNVTVKKVEILKTAPADDTEDPENPENPGDEAPSNPGYVVITPNDTTAADTTAAAPEVVTGANGESVEAPKDVVPEGAVLEAKEQTKEEAVKAVEAVKTTDDNKEVVETVKKSVEDGKAAVMDINLVKDGAKVQPNGTIKVTINIPEILKNAAQLFVYRVEDNGTFTDVKATVSGGKLVFSTGHFSTYIITSEALTGNAVVTEAAATTEPAATTAGGSTSTDDKNQATGVVLAVIPAVLAAAGVVASKKRK